MVNNSNKSTNTLKSLSKEELNTQLTNAQGKGDWAEAAKIIDELQKRETPTKANTFVDDFDKKYEELKKRYKDPDATKHPTEAELKVFFEKDVKKYRGGIDKNINEIWTYKDQKIAELQKQLDETLTDLPGLGEYFSIKRRRLVNITNTIKKLEDDKANYPKNLLIYGMSITNTKIFGTRQLLKRWWIKTARKRKSDDIKNWLKNLEDKLEITSEDTAQRRVIKQMLKEKIKNAKDAYIENVKKTVY